jgi:hypothetical protein
LFNPITMNQESTMITRSRLLRLAAATCLGLPGAWVGSAWAQASDGGFDLVTRSEAQANAKAEAEAPPVIATRQVPIPKPNSPAIKVVSPVVAGTPVTAPLRLEVAFTPSPGARIVPSSFRVLYGLLKIDLTDRMRRHATVTETGVVVDRANVPDGQHRLFLQVADDNGNTAEQELRIRVGAAS